MKPSALRIERQLAKVEAELARSARPRRYCFYFDEEAEAKAQGLPCFLVPRPLSREEWEKEYCHAKQPAEAPPLPNAKAGTP
jgi:hypothetical protein